VSYPTLAISLTILSSLFGDRVAELALFPVSMAPASMRVSGSLCQWAG